MKGRGGTWNRAGRRSGGPRKATIYIPPAVETLTELCRLMIDEHNRHEDTGLTREHIRAIVRTGGFLRGAVVSAFLRALGSGPGDLQQKIAEIFTDNVLRKDPT